MFYSPVTLTLASDKSPLAAMFAVENVSLTAIVGDKRGIVGLCGTSQTRINIGDPNGDNKISVYKRKLRNFQRIYR